MVQTQDIGLKKHTGNVVESLAKSTTSGSSSNMLFSIMFLGRLARSGRRKGTKSGGDKDLRGRNVIYRIDVYMGSANRAVLVRDYAKENIGHISLTQCAVNMKVHLILHAASSVSCW